MKLYELAAKLALGDGASGGMSRRIGTRRSPPASSARETYLAALLAGTLHRRANRAITDGRIAFGQRGGISWDIAEALGAASGFGNDRHASAPVASTPLPWVWGAAGVPGAGVLTGGPALSGNLFQTGRAIEPVPDKALPWIGEAGSIGAGVLSGGFADRGNLFRGGGVLNDRPSQLGNPPAAENPVRDDIRIPSGSLGLAGVRDVVDWTVAIQFPPSSPGSAMQEPAWNGTANKGLREWLETQRYGSVNSHPASEREDIADAFRQFEPIDPMRDWTSTIGMLPGDEATAGIGGAANKPFNGVSVTGANSGMEGSANTIGRTVPTVLKKSTIPGAGKSQLVGGSLPYGEADVSKAILGLANYVGIPEPWARAIASRESSFNPLAEKRKGHHGLFQISDNLWKALGHGDIHNPGDNAAVAAINMRNDYKSFMRSFNRLPSLGETFLMHNQGYGGLKALVEGEKLGITAEQAYARKHKPGSKEYTFGAILNNLPNELKARDPHTILPAEFIGAWERQIMRDLIKNDRNRPTRNKSGLNVPVPPARLRSADIHTKLYLDGRTIAHVVTRHQVAEANGPPLGSGMSDNYRTMPHFA